MSIWSPDYLLHNARDPVMRGDDTWHFLSLGEMFPQCLWGETDREVNTEEPEVGAISVFQLCTHAHTEMNELRSVLCWCGWSPRGTGQAAWNSRWHLPPYHLLLLSHTGSKGSGIHIQCLLISVWHEETGRSQSCDWSVGEEAQLGSGRRYGDSRADTP